MTASKSDKELDIVIDNLDKAIQGAAVDVMESRINKAHKRLQGVATQVMNFLPKERRDPFVARMDRLFNRLALDELGGSKLLKDNKVK